MSYGMTLGAAEGFQRPVCGHLRTNLNSRNILYVHKPVLAALIRHSSILYVLDGALFILFLFYLNFYFLW